MGGLIEDNLNLNWAGHWDDRMPKSKQETKLAPSLPAVQLAQKYPGLRPEIYPDLRPDGSYVVGSGETLYYAELLKLYPAAPSLPAVEALREALLHIKRVAGQVWMPEWGQDELQQAISGVEAVIAAIASPQTDSSPNALMAAVEMARRLGWNEDEVTLAEWIKRFAIPSPQTWQPIETLHDHERKVFFWLVPKTAEESYVDTSGNPITVKYQPHRHEGKWGSWGALSKPTHWMPLPDPPVVASPRGGPAKE